MKTFLLGFSLFIFLAGPVFPGEQKPGNSPQRDPMPAKAIEEVLRDHAKSLMSLPGVVGTGQGRCEGKPCIKVFVIQKTDDLNQKIPKTLEGYPVEVEETGRVKIR